MPTGGSPAWLVQVAKRIERLHDRIRADVAANPARKGRERGENPSLRVRHKIGQLVDEFVALHKKAFGRGNNAVRALSAMLGGRMSATDLYNHSKYAGFGGGAATILQNVLIGSTCFCSLCIAYS